MIRKKNLNSQKLISKKYFIDIYKITNQVELSANIPPPA